ncbi:Uncharacterised protein [Mycobacterium tuberculosis]|nr:Uncharacterised protein [Mycobacterium tuberculosis]
MALPRREFVPSRGFGSDDTGRGALTATAHMFVPSRGFGSDD